MSKSWKEWVDENLARGCDTFEIRDILVKNDIPLAAIIEMMGGLYPGEKTEGTGEFFHTQLPAETYQKLASIPLVQNADTGNITCIASEPLQMYQVANFMSEMECNIMAELIRLRLRPSTITIESEDKYFRTSSTCDLNTHAHPLVAEIDQRISALLGINLSYSEEIQGQHYEVGNEFKAHTDYFEPYTHEYNRFAGARGNRTWTCMIYLNEPAKGGGTYFDALGRSILPVKGMALAWNNLLADGKPNSNTLHAGLPVEEGKKVVITKWYREKGMGEMFLA